MKKINPSIFRLLLAFIFCWLTGCKKFLSIAPPTNQLVSTAVFENEATATAALKGIYSEMMNNLQQFSSGYASLFAGMSADELYFFKPGFRDEFVKNEITLVNHDFLSSAFWGRAYQYIYAANLCIESVERSASLSTSLKRTLTGEAKFIRAFCYYYLFNLFGDVPLITTTGFEGNATAERSPEASVLALVIRDLKDAVSDLSPSYPTADRTRPNKWAAATLLSRAYLHLSDWTNAEKGATDVIQSGMYTLVPVLENVFLKSSGEAIWQLQPVNPTYNTWEGNAILGSGSAEPTYLLTDTLVKSFSSGDKRKTAWTGSRSFLGQTLWYPYKYKIAGGTGAPFTEYYMVLRLAEAYLIRAEARAWQNNLSGALEDLNTIRRRAGLSDTTAADKEALLALIERERQLELFAEWGHRWIDLKRTGRADAVLSSLKPTWKPFAKLWPIPVQQLNLNPSLTQNPGY